MRLSSLCSSSAVVIAGLIHVALSAQDLPTPALLVLNKGDATLSVIDPGSGKTVGQTATGDGPHEVVVSADRRTAFVSNYGSRASGTTLSVIDLLSLRERRVELAPLARPHGLFVSGGQVYFTAEANRAVGRYDPQTDRVDWVMPTDQATTHMVALSADGARLFATNIGSDSVTIMERSMTAPSTWAVTTVPTGKGPEGFDIAPDERSLWVAHSLDGGVSIIDVDAKRVVTTFDIGTRRSNRLKFTPNGRYVLVSDLEAGDLVIIEAATRRVVKRLSLGRQPEGILIVPDGTRAYVAVTGEDHLAVVELPSFEVRGRIDTGDGPDGMAWVR